jgi:glucose/arabinose dehydrogenase
MTARHFLAAAVVAVLGLTSADARAQQGPYRISGRCGDLPRVDLHTADGYCVGLVTAGLKFPRGLLPLDDGRLLVTEMIGWGSPNGRVDLLTPDGHGHYTKKELVRHLNQPHGIALGPDGKIYVGVIGAVKRFDLADPAAVEDVIGGKSLVQGPPGDGRHPLVSLLFTKAGTLLVNVGSFTDNCEDKDGNPAKDGQTCPETVAANPHAQVREYSFDWQSGKATGSRVYGDGMRNSMGLAQYPASGLILEAENSRDSIDAVMPSLANDEDLPPDEINVLEPDGHYGWPYCYGANVPSPEYPHWDCSAYNAPLVELPAHAAPLGMAYWHDGLVLGFHGYRAHGHRVVWFPIDTSGKPNGPFKELISNWEEPQGAPVDVRPGADGALYIAEDHNGTVLRLVAE